MTTPSVTGIRPISQVIQGKQLMEGAGVRICRTLGFADARVDPYLMLDELKLPAIQAKAGFPDHFHRGFSTLSIMLSGRMEHRDSVGNQGFITDGGAQWMTAGRGIIHSEMPVVTKGDLHGFQLWINLPAKLKMTKPRYQDVEAADIPIVQLPNNAGSIRVLAGTVGDVKGPLRHMRTPGTILDVRIAPGGEMSHNITPDWNAFAYVYEGSGRISGQSVKIQHAYVFGNDGDEVVASADASSSSTSLSSSSEQGLKFLLIAGQPLNEPIVQYGPVVMNHPLEIQQAFADYRDGKFQNPDDNPWVDEEDNEDDKEL